MHSRSLLIFGGVLVAAGLLGMSAAPNGGWWEASSWNFPHGAMMGWASGDHDEPTAEPVAGAPTIEVEAVDFGFGPTRIVIPAGEPVNVMLVNEGFFFHDLNIPDAGFHLSARPGGSETGGLAGLEPGEYEILCTVAGHSEAGMVGVLVVEGPAVDG